LGGKLLQDITESSVQAESDYQADSRAESPSGEGQRLADSSRNGLSSALVGVGAAHQAGDGGLQAGTQVRSVEVDEDDEDDELPPKYSNGLRSGEQRVEEGMDIEDSDPGIGMQSHPFSYSSQPAWSFDRATDGTHSQTAAPPGSYYDDDEEGLFDDDDGASNKAVGGGDVSDSDLRLGDDSTGFPSMIVDDVPPASDNDDEELPVVELRVNEDERIVSDD
jgi:ubiquitin carboxyl-terminal hydrolase 4/11/15